MDEEMIGVENQEVAEPETETVETEPAVEETAEESVGSGVADQTEVPDNVWSISRKRAEREAEKNYNQKFSRFFAGATNPRTGAEIKTVDDYFQALDDQKQMRIEAQMKEKGIDPSVLTEAINNNPAVRQAHEILERTQREAAEREMDSMMRTISALDPAIKSVDDLQKMEEFSVFDDLVMNRGYRMDDAFKIACFDRLTSQSKAAAKQAAINAQRSKEHLTTTQSGANAGQTEKEIPADVLPMWQAGYPDLSYAELRTKYNKS